jgi:Mpv17 / PMP22 family
VHHPAQGLDEWQQPLAKIAVDQTVLSLAWNSMYFGMLGAMRLDPPGQVALSYDKIHDDAPNILLCPPLWHKRESKPCASSVVWSIFIGPSTSRLIAYPPTPDMQMLGQLWSSGFSLMKAGWRLWPLAHVITYGLVPAEHRCHFLPFLEAFIAGPQPCDSVLIT